MALKFKRNTKPNPKSTRKQHRKEQRKEKKVRRNEYYTNRAQKPELKPDKGVENLGDIRNPSKDKVTKINIINKERVKKSVLTIEDLRKKEQKQQKKLQNDMTKQRKRHMVEDNIKEDQTIKKLEKQLKLHKRKTKAIPKSFASDGLDYLLEVCDMEYMQNAVSAEQDLNKVNDEFEEDFALMTGQGTNKKKKLNNLNNANKTEDEDNYSGEFQDLFNGADFFDGENENKPERSKLKDSELEDNDILEHFEDLLDSDLSDDDIIINSQESELKDMKMMEKLHVENKANHAKQKNKSIQEENAVKKKNHKKLKENKKSKESTIKISNITPKKTKKKNAKNNETLRSNKVIIRELSDDDPLSGDEESYQNLQNDRDEDFKNIPNKRKMNKEKFAQCLNNKGKKVLGKKKKIDRNIEEGVSEEESSESEDEVVNLSEKNEDENQKSDSVWEDIYGRLRTKDGAVINKAQEKYVPPAKRPKLEGNGMEDKKRKEKLERLKKQLKGLLNRLAESNMHNISSQIEDLYMNNSRNDMNETLTTLIFDSLVSNILTPERLLMEHVLLVAVLHANVGTEVGAHFLQTVIKKFDNILRTAQTIDNKTLNNLVGILAQLYNFKVFDAKLLYEILQKLTDDFDEKNVECILQILRSVGFGLRKDDPIALKNLILELQKQAASASEGKVSNSRVKFLLDVLLAIKNNNVTKIPNYDTSYSEHLKKIMKGFVRKGNYVTQLNIALEDLLKADERGRWWVVGSAWMGTTDNNDKKEKLVKADGFSKKMLDLACKQRMNTDTRRDIFCIMMSAEDYLDAFEKLLKLSLKNQQEREIIHVILHCCLQEKVYNPYYAVLAQKFCEYDRRFQMTIKCSVWDKLKSLNDHSGKQISNLAKLLTHLFIEKSLPISTLKIVEFNELDKASLRFIRQILLGILLHPDLEALQGVFEKVVQSDKLKMFRESLRLFIHHFLLRNLKSEAVPEDQKENLKERAKMVEKILTARDFRTRL